MAETPPPASLQDGDSVPAGYLLFRVIPNDQAHWVQEERRATGFNFCPSTTQEHLSMKLGIICTAEEILEENPGLGLLEIDAGSLVSRRLRAIYTPQLGKGHVSVDGLKGGAAVKKMRNAICEELLRVWEPVTQKLVFPRPQ